MDVIANMIGLELFGDEILIGGSADQTLPFIFKIHEVKD